MPKKITLTSKIKHLKSFPLTVGADPEFAVYHPTTHQFISANNILMDEDYREEIGLDGNSDTGELRPKPQSNPLALAKEIKRLVRMIVFNSEYVNLRKNNLHASSEHLALGGHIHFGHSLLQRPRMPSRTSEQIRRNTSQSLSEENSYFAKERDWTEKLTTINKCLDLTIGFPLMFLEKENYSKQRKNRGYGRLKDWRVQPHGFEYRTPPSFIAEEKLTQAILTIAYSTVFENLFYNWLPPFRMTNITGFETCYQENFSMILKPYLKLCYKNIKELTGYHLWKDHFQYLFRNASREKEILTTEIKSGWGFKIALPRQPKPLNPKTFLIKLLKYLPKDTMPDRIRTFTASSSEDYQCENISNKVDKTLSYIIPDKTIQHTPPVSLYIFGYKKERENKNTLFVPRRKNTIPSKKIRKIILAIKKINDYLNNDDGFRINWKYSYNSSFDIALSRKIREKKNYTAEVIVSLLVLYLNNNYFTSKKNPVGLPIICSFIIKNLAKLKEMEKPVQIDKKAKDSRPENSRDSRENPNSIGELETRVTYNANNLERAVRSANISNGFGTGTATPADRAPTRRRTGTAETARRIGTAETATSRTTSF